MSALGLILIICFAFAIIRHVIKSRERVLIAREVAKAEIEKEKTKQLKQHQKIVDEWDGK